MGYAVWAKKGFYEVVNDETGKPVTYKGFRLVGLGSRESAEYYLEKVLMKKQPKGEGRRKRNNPSEDENFDAATSVSEGFHGRKSLYVEDIIEIERYRTKLAHLGDLVELEILDDSGKHVIPISFAVHDSEEHVSVASTPDRNQLIFSGGNQGIELESFPDLTDNEKCKDYVRIGEVFSISYFTDKHHLEGPKYQKDGTEYIHQFGEEDGGVRPELMYDTLNQRMILVGGSYEVKDEGIYN